MANPASIADLKTQKITTVDLFSGDVEAFRQDKVVLLNLLDDQSARAQVGVDSFILFDEEEQGIENMVDGQGSEQNDLGGGVLHTKLVINQFKTVPRYFSYMLGEASRIDFKRSFLAAAPTKAILAVEEAAYAALRGIGATAGKYKQMSGTNTNGDANTVPTVADYVFALGHLVDEMKLDMTQIYSVSGHKLSMELPAIFGFYDKEATSALGDLAKSKGFVREIMDVPHFSAQVMSDNEHIIFHKRAVSYAIRTAAELHFESQKSKQRDYYGVNISYGVVARQDGRAVVMQSGSTYIA